jgi:hypothetical protein
MTKNKDAAIVLCSICEHGHPEYCNFNKINFISSEYELTRIGAWTYISKCKQFKHKTK